MYSDFTASRFIEFFSGLISDSVKGVKIYKSLTLKRSQTLEANGVPLTVPHINNSTRK